jgi:hypothetical protein
MLIILFKTKVYIYMVEYMNNLYIAGTADGEGLGDFAPTFFHRIEEQ